MPKRTKPAPQKRKKPLTQGFEIATKKNNGLACPPKSGPVLMGIVQLAESQGRIPNVPFSFFFPSVARNSRCP